METFSIFRSSETVADGMKSMIRTDIGAFPVYAVDEQFNGADVVAGQKHPGRLLDAILDQC